MEYEWKPPFCTTCQKVGHECKEKVKQTKKQQERNKQIWMEKRQNKVLQPKNTSAIKTHRENKEDNVALEDDAVKPEWTVVWSKQKGKERKTEGNNPMKIGNISLGCKNGFEVLRIDDRPGTVEVGDTIGGNNV